MWCWGKLLFPCKSSDFIVFPFSRNFKVSSTPYEGDTTSISLAGGVEWDAEK